MIGCLPTNRPDRRSRAGCRYSCRVVFASYTIVWAPRIVLKKESVLHPSVSPLMDTSTTVYAEIDVAPFFCVTDVDNSIVAQMCILGMVFYQLLKSPQAWPPHYSFFDCVYHSWSPHFFLVPSQITPARSSASTTIPARLTSEGISSKTSDTTTTNRTAIAVRPINFQSTMPSLRCKIARGVNG